jgi:acid phosphatase
MVATLRGMMAKMKWAYAGRIDALLRRLAAALVVATAVFAAAPSGARAATPFGCDAASLASMDRSDPHFVDLVYYRCNFYDQDVAAVLQSARNWVDWRAPYAHNPALVLDIDETSLSNWRQLYQNKFVFIPSGPCPLAPGTTCGQSAWELSARGVALVPTRGLFYAARADHVAVFFISGRHEGIAERAATVANLLRAGYAGWTRLFLRTARFNGDPSVSTYKTWARSQIAAQGYTIIANAGDQWSDLEGGYAERTFKVPNPFYFIP